jgi:hypothetical protein
LGGPLSRDRPGNRGGGIVIRDCIGLAALFVLLYAALVAGAWIEDSFLGMGV